MDNQEKFLKEDVKSLGGKAESLMRLLDLGYKVPDFITIPDNVFQQFLLQTDLSKVIIDYIDELRITTEINDISCVKEISENIKEAFLSTELPKDLSALIVDKYKLLISKTRYSSTGGVSVRSSVIGEDSKETSFAGLHDTYLNVLTENDLLISIKKCWASSWNPQAILYRKSNRLSLSEVRTGVIIQNIVEGDKSGVAFSVEPVNGNYNEVLIQAAYGLCKGVVDGNIPTDTYAFDKKARKINIYRSTNGKKNKTVILKKGGGVEEADVQIRKSKKWCLSKKQQYEVAETILNLESQYGQPMEMEFSYRNDVLLMLQARPITNLNSKRNFSFEWKSEEDKKYTWKVRDFKTYAPLETSDFIHYEESIRPVSKRFSIPVISKRKVINSRVYCLHTLKKKAVPLIIFMLRIIWQKLLSLIQAVNENFRKQFGFIPNLTPFFKTILWQYEWDRLLPKLKVHINTLSKITDSVQNANYSEIYRDYLQFIDISRNIFIIHNKGAASNVIHKFGSYLSMNDLLVFSQGIETMTTTIKNEVWEISKIVKENQCLFDELNKRTEYALKSDTSVNLSDLISLDGWQVFTEKVTEFIERNGRRSLKMTEPTWKENNSQLIRWILDISKKDEQQLNNEKERILSEALDCRKRILYRVPKIKRFWVEYKLGVLEASIKFLDDHNYFTDQSLAGEQRLFYTRLAKRFCEEKTLKDPNQIFFIYENELLNILEKKSNNEEVDVTELMNMIYLREIEYNRHKELYFPMKIGAIEKEKSQKTSKGISMAGLLIEDKNEIGKFDGKTLLGISASVGIGEGKVRIVQTEKDFKKVEPGDILICADVEPGWIVLFSRINGLVVDRGKGILQHSAVIAREFNIPAVIGTEIAAKILKEGQLIRVDGTNGIVIILE